MQVLKVENEMYDNGKYREPGVKWSIEETPVKWTRPKAYVYDCEKCGKEFKAEYKIHIPWCEDCRVENVDRLRAEWEEKDGSIISDEFDSPEEEEGFKEGMKIEMHKLKVLGPVRYLKEAEEEEIQEKMKEIKERSIKGDKLSREALNRWKQRFYDMQLREAAIKEIKEENEE
jgi:hypothetical protein